MLSMATVAIGAMTGGALALDPTAKWCSGVKIAAFPGGPQGGVFANNVYNGFRQAELDLGPTGHLLLLGLGSEHDAEPDPAGDRHQGRRHRHLWLRRRTGNGPLVEQAFAQGTIFTTSTPRCRTARRSIRRRASAMSAPRTMRRALRSATEAAKRAKLASGDSVFVWGLKGQGGDRGQRTVGVIDAFEKAGAKVIYQEIDAATNADPNAGTATFVGVMEANPGIKIVVTDHGGLTSNVGVYAKAASLKPGQVYFAGFDMSPNTAQAVKNGYQNLVIDQQPYLQGYLPILNICLTKKFGFSGLDINTAGAFVDSSNVDAVAPLAAKEIR